MTVLKCIDQIHVEFRGVIVSFHGSRRLIGRTSSGCVL